MGSIAVASAALGIQVDRFVFYGHAAQQAFEAEVSGIESVLKSVGHS